VELVFKKPIVSITALPLLKALSKLYLQTTDSDGRNKQLNIIARFPSL
jgi:hypothetical protein